MGAIAPAQQREIAYNAYLASLDKSELDAYLRCNSDNPSDGSLELFFHDIFVARIIAEDYIAKKILELLGEF